MELLASERFLRKYNKASLGLKNLSTGAVHDFIHRHFSDPATVKHRYDKLAHTRANVLEIDLSSGHRLLANYEDNELALLDMGGHKVVKRYSDKEHSTDISTLRPAPLQFWPGQRDFFRRNPDNTCSVKYHQELSPEWLYYLDDKQKQIDNKISSKIWKMILSNYEPRPFFIIGGPGTGKTCILLNLLNLFADIDDSFTVKLLASDSLIEYVEMSTSASIQEYVPWRNGYPLEADLLLVDDPYSKDEIERILSWQKEGFVGAVVLAFDPLQLSSTVSDNVYNNLVNEYDVHTFNLSTSYRQKENVGRETKHVIDVVANSTPYLADYKIERHHKAHVQLTSLANNLSFVNPAGYVEFYPNSKIIDVEFEVNQILENRWLMWQHFPGLLVVEGVSSGLTLSEDTKAPFAKLEDLGYVRWVHLDDIDSVKGLEFQHVFIFIESEMFDQIQNGFSGLGNKKTNKRRLMRIPFSRAKDRLVTFVLNSSQDKQLTFLGPRIEQM